MTDKQKLDAIKAEIHRLVDVRGYDREMANDLLAFMNSLPNEPVSEDLEKAADEYAKDYLFTLKPQRAPNIHFINGANWQKRKDEKNIGELQWNAHAEGWDECKQEMMKDAIDTTIKQGCTELVILIKGLNEDKFSFGDKVKIIVVKED